MKPSGKWIAVALVATALCADRTIAAAPELRSQMSVAGRIVSRLTSGFGRAVSAVRIYEPRQETRVLRPLAPSRIIEAAAPTATHQQVSPFQFRLPPPTI